MVEHRTQRNRKRDLKRSFNRLIEVMNNVSHLHMGVNGRCREDGQVWPCATIDVLGERKTVEQIHEERREGQ